MIRSRFNNHSKIHRSKYNHKNTSLKRTRTNNSHSPTDNVKLCKCGCGQPVNNGKTWISGHNFNGLYNPTHANPYKGGRPTTYRPYMCDVVIEQMKLGKVRVQVAAALGVDKNTLWEWMKKYPEFNEAVKIGESFSEAHWATIAEDNIQNNKFNTGLFVFYTANMFGWKRTDSSLQVQMSGDSKVIHEHQHSGEVKVDVGSVKAVLGILVRSGCLAAGLTAGAVDRGEPGAEAIIDSQDDQVHQAYSNP